MDRLIARVSSWWKTRWSDVAVVAVCTIVFIAVGLALVFAQAPASCEDRLAVVNQLLTDVSRQRNNVEIELAAIRVHLDRTTKEFEATKAELDKLRPKKADEKSKEKK